MKAAELYDLDFAQWAEQNAELLRAGKFAEADIANIAEEIESLARRDRRQLYNRLVRLAEHLLKWQFQPERRGTSWKHTILQQRRGIRQLLEESPSLRPALEDVIAAVYQDAANGTAIVTDRPRKEFPETCPYTIEQMLDEEFLP
jgi:hypothetical protein